MSENQFHYGTNFTSVKTHQAPGGNSSISFGDYEEPKAPVKPQATEEVKAEDPEVENPEEEEKEEEEKEPEVAGARSGEAATTSVKVH